MGGGEVNGGGMGGEGVVKDPKKGSRDIWTTLEADFALKLRVSTLQHTQTQLLSCFGFFLAARGGDSHSAAAQVPTQVCRLRRVERDDLCRFATKR